MIEHALAAVANGHYVFPLAPGTKVPPKGTRGLTDATTDKAQIEQWWATWPEANVGIATGPSKLVVIDIDVPKEPLVVKDEVVRDLFGMEAWISLVANAIGHDKAEPRSYEVWTPSGGEHIYFQAPKAMTIKTGASKLANGIDVRATGGSIVAAGSKTAKGTYEIHKHHKPAQLPSFLKHALRSCGLVDTPVEARTKAAIIDTRKVSNGDSYADGAFKLAIEELKRTPIGQGQRNSSVFKAASQLRRFIEPDKEGKIRLNAQVVGDALFAVATGDLAMKDTEAIATIKSGLAL